MRAPEGKIAGWVQINPEYLNDIKKIGEHFDYLKKNRPWFYLRLLIRK